MAEAVASLAAMNATQIPLGMLAALHLTGVLWPEEKPVINNTFFDYLIIGGGTAGMVVANRLSENPDINVAVFEAGGDPPINALLPSLLATEPLSPLDWNFTSTYDSYASNSQTGNVIKLTSGKMLGGSSCLNHFMHVRGAPYDFNNWADVAGDPSWRYEGVLPYFKKSEKLDDVVVENSPYGQYHGYNGPMGLTKQPSLAANPYLVSFGELGNNIVLDVNGPDTLGYSQSMYTLKDGVRQCTSFSYINPIKDRKNLFVFRHTYITKIIFDKNKNAIAVVAYRNNEKYIFRASREIILSAGTFKTPQILMLSGIGHKEHLKSFNLECIADLPVGDNLQDHIAVSLVHRTDQSVVDPVDPLLTMIPFPVIIGTVALNKSQPYGDYQVYGIIAGKEMPNLNVICSIIMGYKPEICDRFNNETLGFNSIFSILSLLYPESKGNIRLKSSDPFSDPEITTGFLTVDSDLDRMVAIVKDYMRIGGTTFFNQVNASIIDQDYEECKNYIFDSDEYWKCYILHTAATVYHYTSTCAMGTVVDNKLRVKDVNNLRIVDASVMPAVPGGNSHAAVVMIAEKASDMIKEDTDKFTSCKECSETTSSTVRT